MWCAFSLLFVVIGVSLDFFCKDVCKEICTCIWTSFSNHVSHMDERSRLGKAPLHYVSRRGMHKGSKWFAHGV